MPKISSDQNEAERQVQLLIHVLKNAGAWFHPKMVIYIANGRTHIEATFREPLELMRSYCL